MKRGVSTILAALLILVIVLAAVGAYGWLRPTQNVTETVYVPVTLEQAARNETSLVIYGVMDTPDFETWVKPAFLAQYPWASITYAGGGPSDLFARATSEYQAGRVAGDVVMALGFPNHRILYEQGVVTPYADPMIDWVNFSQTVRDPRNITFPAYGIPVVLGYNTNLVPTDQVPTEWTDLADPKWDGKIVMDTPKILNVAGSFLPHLYPIMGNASWTAFLQGLAANHPILLQSAGDAYSMVASGGASLTIMFLNDYLAGLKQGLPVGVAWLPPITFGTTCASVLTNAPHPNMAKLFLTWMHSVAGMEAIAKTGRVPMKESIAVAAFSGIIPAGQTFEISGNNNPAYLADPQGYADIFQSIFG